MKNIKRVIVGILLMFIGIPCVYAGTTLNISNTTVYVGDNFNISVSITNSVSWFIDAYVDGIADCRVYEQGFDMTGEGVNKTFTKTCKATTAGTYTVRYRDSSVTDANNNTSIPDQTKSFNIVIKPTTTTTSSTSKSTTTVKKDVTTQAKKEQVTEATTTTAVTEPITEQVPEVIKPTLNSLSIVGYDIDFKDGVYEYSIEVAKNVKSLYVVTNGDNELYTVSGTGEISIIDQDKIVITVSDINDPTNKTEYTIKLISPKKEDIKKIDYSKVVLLFIVLLISIAINIVFIYNNKTVLFKNFNKKGN